MVRVRLNKRDAALGCVLGAALLVSACASSQHLSLSGTLRNGAYTSSGGHFTVPAPVSPEVGGRVKSDTRESVTFTDNWGSRVTFASFPFNDQSSMEVVIRAQGRDKALEDFMRAQYGTMTQIHYDPDVLGGAATLVYLRPVGPRTGAAAFVQGHRVFVVETDLLPGVQLLTQGDGRDQENYNGWLEKRAVELAQTMQVQ